MAEWTRVLGLGKVSARLVQRQLLALSGHRGSRLMFAIEGKADIAKTGGHVCF